MTSPYDSFAWFYHRYWASPHQEWQTPALEQLLFPSIPPGARILDLCCGTGQLSQRLVARGYNVTGLDSSGEMLRFAREDVPEARFLLADATNFTLEETVDAVVCTFDSLNHILEPEKLALAFSCVHAALNRGGRFVFDINTPAAYGSRWDDTASEVAPDHVFFLRGGYDPQARIGTTKITMFRLLEKCWQRADVEMRQRPWEVREIENMLTTAGFTGIASYQTRDDLGIMGHYGEGRVHVVCETSLDPDVDGPPLNEDTQHRLPVRPSEK